MPDTYHVGYNANVLVAASDPITAKILIEDEISNELRELGAELRFKPVWLENLVGLARHLLGATH